MKAYIGVTDFDWYQFLRARPEITEVNFWRPSPQRFRALSSGEPFFFKLKAPRNAIAGFGLFSRDLVLPIMQAWEAFGTANGTKDINALRERLGRLSTLPASHRELLSVIGCTAITEPIFFAPDEWVAPPTDWAKSIQKGKTYDLTTGEGKRLWDQCLERAQNAKDLIAPWASQAIENRRHGKPFLVTPRLGQSTFRFGVIDAYDHQCAVTTEHSIPVLEAAHIRPWANGGAHEDWNGIHLCRAIHSLFDLGYVTIRPDLTFVVSHRLKDEFDNGRVYYALQGTRIRVPSDPHQRPDRELLEWYGDAVFQA